MQNWKCDWTHVISVDAYLCHNDLIVGPPGAFSPLIAHICGPPFLPTSHHLVRANMSDEHQLSPRLKPKSLLDAHRDERVLIQALNEFAASQRKPVSRDMMSDVNRVSSSCASSRVLFPKSMSPDPPESSSQDQAQDTIPSASTGANPPPIPKPGQLVKASGIPRRKPVVSYQPSVSELLELGVKVRDFAYERSALPPVPIVYLQPRQIQPSVPKDVNDPDDPHYVLEEERKKKVYTFESTRKIQRTPTEPILESELLPPPRRTFPKIKRTHAMLDIGSQFDSEPQSQPMPSYPALPYDITNTPQSTSQPVPGFTTDSQPTEPWADTPIVTPNGSLQEPKKPMYTVTSSTAPSTSTAMQPKVVVFSASPVASEMNFITSTTHSPPEPETETMSSSQMGVVHLGSQALILGGRAGGGVEAAISISGSRDHPSQQQSSSSPVVVAQGSSKTLQHRVESDISHVDDTVALLAPTSPIAPSPVGESPRDVGSASPAQSPVQSIPPVAGPSRLPLPSSPSPPPTSEPLSSIDATTIVTPPRYNLRNKNKRQAEFPPPTSPASAHPSSRQKLTRSTRAVSSPGKPKGTMSVNSVHYQDKTIDGVISTGRTMKKRPRDSVGDDDVKVEESISVVGGETQTRRSKRRNKAS